MRTRRTVALVLLACATGLIGLLPSAVTLAAPGQFKDQNTASDSFYRLDVPNGTVSARVEVTVQNGSFKDMTRATLWAMPRAEGLQVMFDGQPLEIKVTPWNAAAETPTTVDITLPRTLKPDARIDLEMTYQVPPQTSELVRLEPGATEALFVSQGPGSFVFLDLPAEAENVLDPGCLVALNQPSDVKDAGLERWVCGEVTLIALAANDASTLERCARLDDRCRQRLDRSPFSAFVQSVSDPSLRAVLQETVTLGRGEVTLELRYFKSDGSWAAEQFALAKQVLPSLEALFGFNYPHERLLMRQSHHIGMIGAAGVAFSDIGQVLLASGTGVDEEVTVHELAHQWAGYQVETNWMWEGLAEWATQSLAPGFGVHTRDWAWQSTGYTDPIGLWWNGSSVTDGYYWYGKSAAFWFEYEKAIGGRENMTRVLSLMDDYEADWPLNGEWFVDRGEEVSGANLDELFLTWVFNRTTATPVFAQRRSAHNAVAVLRARVAEFGFEGIPEDIQDNLDYWTFRSVEGQVAEANRLLDDYAKLVADVAAANLPQLDNVRLSWNTGTIRETRGVIADQQQALDAIVNTTLVLAEEEPNSPSMKELSQALELWAAGNLDEAASMAATAATTSFNEDAALKLIALAKETQAKFNPSFLGRIGLIGQDPDGTLRQAEEAYAAGEPTRSLELAESAYKTWNAADRTGLQRLAILMGAMCALCAGVFWLLRRLDGPDIEFKRDPDAARGGHNLGDPETRRPSWKDWENTN